MADKSGLDAAVAAKLRDVVGEAGWKTGADAAPYLEERRGVLESAASAVVQPDSTDQVAAVVGICAEAGVAIVPQGGNTGLVGGTVARPGQVIVNLSRLNRIRDLDPLNNTLTAEAGCVLADLQRAAADADRLFPLSLAAEGSCQIGGNLSTNAGGTAVLRYGTARELVLGLEVVLPDGRVLGSLRALRKDNAGYDLKQLFLGAEGTLGIITAAVCKLFPRPREVQTSLAGLPGAGAAIELLALARSRAGETVTSFELMSRRIMEFALDHVPGNADPLGEAHPWYVLVELSSARADSGLGSELEGILETALDKGLVSDATVAASEAQRQALWRLRETAPEAQKFEGASIKHDVSVPIPRIADFIETAGARAEARFPGLRVVAFGHVGDGNVHFNLSQPKGGERADFEAAAAGLTRIVHDTADEMGGSISAEHGLGLVKREDLRRYKSALELELMSTLKAALDPRGIMNPGKVL